MAGVVLPPLVQMRSPNQSVRRGVVPYLIVVHRPVGSYAGATATFMNPASDVSAHILTNSNKEATQFVPWDRKAWTQGSFNSVSYGLEIDDDAWNGKDEDALETAARIVAFLCKRTGIPPNWSTSPLTKPGVVRHYDLGNAGGGHSDPTLDLKLWRRFIVMVKDEFDRGGFRPTWGIGELKRIDT